MNEKLEATRRLYNKHPFGRFDYDRARYFENMLCTRHAKQLEKSDVIYDIGCGLGFVSEFLQKRTGNKCIGADLSAPAVKYCRDLGLEVYEMNNMHLGFASGVSDFTISSGVIHHSPDPKKSFLELLRITKKGKKAYVSVYRKYSSYHLTYFLCAPIRWLYKKQEAFVYSTIFPIFYFLYFVPLFFLLQGKVINKQTGLTLFADQILTPQASFHTKREISTWIHEAGAKLVDFAVEKKGQMIGFIIEV